MQCAMDILLITVWALPLRVKQYMDLKQCQGIYSYIFIFQTPKLDMVLCPSNRFHELNI